jgi:hypothetical protein
MNSGFINRFPIHHPTISHFHLSNFSRWNNVKRSNYTTVTEVSTIRPKWQKNKSTINPKRVKKNITLPSSSSSHWACFNWMTFELHLPSQHLTLHLIYLEESVLKREVVMQYALSGWEQHNLSKSWESKSSSHLQSGGFPRCRYIAVRMEYRSNTTKRSPSTHIARSSWLQFATN